MADSLLPVIHAADWPHRDTCLHSRLLLDDERSPLIVTYATDPHELSYYLKPEPEQDVDAIRLNAAQYWTDNTSSLPWMELSFPGGPAQAMAIRGGNFLTSSVLLAHGHLKGLHQYFDLDELGIIVPSRGTVVVHPDFLALANLGRKLYEDAKDRQRELSPHCLFSFSGQVRGWVTPEYESEFGGNFLPEEELLDLAERILTCALVMAGSKGASDAGLVQPFAEPEGTIIERACHDEVTNAMKATSSLSRDTTGHLQLLTTISQALYQFDKGAPEHERESLRDVLRSLIATLIDQYGDQPFSSAHEDETPEKYISEMLDETLR